MEVQRVIAHENVCLGSLNNASSQFLNACYVSVFNEFLQVCVLLFEQTMNGK